MRSSPKDGRIRPDALKLLASGCARRTKPTQKNLLVGRFPSPTKDTKAHEAGTKQNE
jgi:hypothetical protein